MEAGFNKASSNNLLTVDALMIGHFLSGHADYVGPEQRGVKLSQSSRENCGDAAIGYVQVKRDGGKCFVMAKVTPEHRLKVKPYTVAVTVNEDEEIIEDINCYGCAAGVGGCKHAIAVLMWLHRRSEEPSPTEVESYWRKSKLSALSGCSSIMKVEEMTGAAPICEVEEGSFRRKVVAALEKEGEFESGLMSLTFCLNANSLSIHHMLLAYRANSEAESSAFRFLEFAKNIMREQDLCGVVFKNTMAQNSSPLWHRLRLGRISASRAFDVMHCKKKVLVDVIVGARKIRETSAMKRGRELEGEVLGELQRRFGVKIEECGLALDPEFPYLGATPDGVFNDTVVEVKCPKKASRLPNYLKDGFPTEKYATQMTMQMLLMGKKCLFAVADPQFEDNKIITTCEIEFLEEFSDRIVKDTKEFWCNTIFPKLNKE